ncbi:hypothetical protein [Flavobacterium sp. J27]|uniref:hypothetical protein n=1 Tax=Flavobacterium sp. J27 TaxID=2060419 RepID=UPI0010315C99|nr:hypothetical protein [Flavobacterium sp. J27]
MKLTNQQIKYAKRIGGISLAGFLLYLFFKPKKQDTGGLVTDPTNNNDTWGNNNNTNTYFDPQKVAENLYLAMKDLGTDEDLIFSSLKNVNQSQFSQVVEAFGVRNYNPFSGNTLSFVKHPLSVWLKSELSDSEYNTLKLKYPNYL